MNISQKKSASALSSDAEADLFLKLSDLCRDCEAEKEFSYREICEHLGFSFTKSGSNARKKQIKQIQCYCDLTKVRGYKYSLSNMHTPEQVFDNKTSVLMQRFDLMSAEATEPCYFAIVSIRTNYGIIGECDNFTKQYSKMYEESLTRKQVSYGGLLMEPHFVQIWLKSRNGVDRNSCIYDLECQNIYVLNKYTEAEGRHLHKQLENQLQMCALFAAIEDACKKYDWDEEKFVDKLILNIEKNPGNWMHNTIMYMSSNRGSRGGLDVGHIFYEPEGEWDLC